MFRRWTLDGFEPDEHERGSHSVDFSFSISILIFSWHLSVCLPIVGKVLISCWHSSSIDTRDDILQFKCVHEIRISLTAPQPKPKNDNQKKKRQHRMEEKKKIKIEIRIWGRREKKTSVTGTERSDNNNGAGEIGAEQPNAYAIYQHKRQRWQRFSKAHYVPSFEAFFVARS